MAKRQAKKEEILWQRIVEKTVHLTTLLKTAAETVLRPAQKTAAKILQRTAPTQAPPKMPRTPMMHRI